MHRWLILGLVVILLASSITVAIFLFKPVSQDEYSLYSHDPFYVSISADGNYILARYRASDGFVQLFSQGDNSPLWTALYPTSWIESSSISDNGEYIAVGAREAFYLLRRGSNEPLWTFYPTNALKTALISSDGNYLVSADYDKLNFFSRTSNVPIWSCDGYYQSVSISSDGSSLAVGGDGNTYLFGKDDNTPLWSYSSEMSVSISSDGNYIAASGGGPIYLFTKTSSVPVWSYSSFSAERFVRKTAISSDGNYVAATFGEYIISSGERGKEYLYVFNRENGQLLWSSTLDATSSATLLAITSNGDHIVAGDSNKLRIFSRTDNTPLWSYEFSEHEEASSVAMSSDGNYIAVGTEGGPAPNIGGSIYLFSKDSSQPLWVYNHEVEPYGYG